MATTERAVLGGISFELTEEQKELRALAREFAEKEIRPRAAEYDERSTHPADVITKAHELGLMNVHVAEEYGGLGLPGFEGMLIGEELSWGCSGMAVSIVANTLGAAPVANHAFMWIVSVNQRSYQVFAPASRSCEAAMKPTTSATNAKIRAGRTTHFGDRRPSAGGASHASTPDMAQSKPARASQSILAPASPIPYA